MIREDVTDLILESRREKGLTFAAIAEQIGKPKVWAVAALLGQHPMDAETAETVVDLLDLPPEAAPALQEIPMRGSLESDVPTDPTIYRIHEITQVYGTTIKALINEEFGDGIMSHQLQHGHRARRARGRRITYEGKFLPYQWS